MDGLVEGVDGLTEGVEGEAGGRTGRGGEGGLKIDEPGGRGKLGEPEFRVGEHIYYTSLNGSEAGSLIDSPFTSIGFSELKGRLMARLNSGVASFGVASTPLSRRN